MKILEIEKPNANIVCWKVDTDGIAYNTELRIAQGLTLLINLEGTEKVAMSGKKTLGSILNPDKAKKLFGGKSECDCSIIAMNEEAEYSAPWGIGLENVADVKTHILQKVQANGSYYFKIYSMQNFLSAMNVQSKEVLSQDDVKLMLREKTHEIVKSNISKLLAKKNVLDAQADISALSSSIIEILNTNLAGCGVKFSKFIINKLGLAQEEQEIIQRINEAQVITTIAKVKNQAIEDELAIKAKYQYSAAALHQDDSKVVICTKCKTENAAGAIYCSRCGEKLV